MRKKFTTPPVEECRKDVLNVAGGLSVTPGLVYPARATTRAKLERIFGYVFTAVAQLKKLPAFSPLEIRAEGRAKKGPWTEYEPTSREVPDGGTAISVAGSPGGSGRETDGESDGGQEAPG